MGIAYNTSVVRDGLVLHLDAANVKSYPGTGTTWTDVSASRNSFDLTNSPTYDSVDGSFEFDGSNDSVEAESLSELNISGNKTLLFFAQQYDSGGEGTLIEHGVTGRPISNSLQYGLYMNQSRYLTFKTFTGSGRDATLTDIDSSATAFNLNQWHYVGCVVDGTTCTFYVDGETAGSGSVLVPDTTPFATGIGGHSLVSSAPYLSGAISIGQVYNRALSQTEIRQNFNAFRGRFGV